MNQLIGRSWPLVDPASPTPSRRSVGGKALHLHLLGALGAPVPAWFCVPAEVFEQHVAPIASALDAILAGAAPADPASIEAAAHGARALVLGLTLHPDLAAAITDRLDPSITWAVRSSAAAEDGAATSFAGQLDTWLYVAAEDVVDHIVRCWASGFTTRVVAYMLDRGLDPRANPVAVVVQEMVTPRTSGVLFTADPVGSLDELVVVAGLGTGEGVVADIVATDRYQIDRRSREVVTTLGHKSTRVVRGESGGTVVESVPTDEADAPALSDAEVAALVSEALRIEAGLGRYQDIEWAIDAEGSLKITQARPISTIPEGRHTLFDNSNIVEGYPGVSHPLTFSFVRAGYAGLFRSMLLELGVDARDVDAARPGLESLVAYVDGRIYMNLSSWYGAFSMIPGTGAFLPTWEEMMGLPAGGNTGTRLTWRNVPTLLRAARTLAGPFFRLAAHHARFKTETRALLASFWETDLDAATSHDLVTTIHRIHERVRSRWTLTLYNDAYAFSFSGLTKALLARAGVAAPDRLFNHLLCGEEGMESVEPIRSVVRLAEGLRTDPVALAAVRVAVEADAPLASLASEPRAAAFLAGVEAHIAAYGDRCLEELKIETPTFRRDPRGLLVFIESYVETDITVEGMEAREAALRATAEAELSASVSTLQAVAIRASLRFARRSIKVREAMRLDRARMFGAVKEAFLRLGERLVTARALGGAHDVTFLTLPELIGFVDGTAIDTDLAAIVDRRRAALAQVGPPPKERFQLRGAFGAGIVPRKARDLIISDDQVRGTGCSPGAVEGEALVVTDPRNAGDVCGKILVAEMTDPGWVFLMTRAAGLISERGSLLSHTAIIGRELGIPTAVGVTGATRRIVSGQRIRLDGDTGVITLLEGAP